MAGRQGPATAFTSRLSSVRNPAGPTHMTEVEVAAARRHRLQR